MAQRQDLNQGGQGEDDLESVAADYYVVKSVDLDELKMKTNMALEGTVSLLTEKRMKKMGGRGKERFQVS